MPKQYRDMVHIPTFWEIVTLLRLSAMGRVADKPTAEAFTDAFNALKPGTCSALVAWHRLGYLASIDVSN